MGLMPMLFHQKLLPKKKPDDVDEVPVVNPTVPGWRRTKLSSTTSSPTFTRRFLGHVNKESTSRGAWMAIEALFVSQSCAKIIIMHMALTSATKGTSTIMG
jgi:hypothetical protein